MHISLFAGPSDLIHALAVEANRAPGPVAPMCNAVSPLGAVHEQRAA